MPETVIGPVQQFPEGSNRVVEVAGRQYGIFNVGGQLYALANVCPHEGGPVCEGSLWGLLTAEILPDGEVREYYASEGDVLACPWHGWEFDVRTGHCLADPKYKLHRLPVRTVNGMVVVES